MIVLSYIVYTIYYIKSTKRQKKLPYITAIEKQFWIFCSNGKFLSKFLQFCALLNIVGFSHLAIDVFEHFRIVFEIFEHSVSALTDLFVLIAEPAATLLDYALFNRKIKHATRVGDAASVHDIKLCDLERRCNFVLDNLGFHVVADNVASILQSIGFSYIYADGCVEFERLATCCCLRVSIHYANLFTELVDEDDCALAL